MRRVGQSGLVRRRGGRRSLMRYLAPVRRLCRLVHLVEHSRTSPPSTSCRAARSAAVLSCATESAGRSRRLVGVGEVEADRRSERQRVAGLLEQLHAFNLVPTAVLALARAVEVAAAIHELSSHGPNGPAARTREARGLVDVREPVVNPAERDEHLARVVRGGSPPGDARIGPRPSARARWCQSDRGLLRVRGAAGTAWPPRLVARAGVVRRPRFAA